MPYHTIDICKHQQLCVKNGFWSSAWLTKEHIYSRIYENKKEIKKISWNYNKYLIDDIAYFLFVGTAAVGHQLETIKTSFPESVYIDFNWDLL